MNELSKKVLQELTINSRQSYNEIAKKISSKKDSVAYTVKKLEDDGIIDKYVPVFSLNMLNLSTFKIYFNLKGTSKMKEDEIVRWLKNKTDVLWVARSVDQWNLMIGFIDRYLHDFSKQKKEVLNYLSDYISDYRISFIEDGFTFDRKYLFNKKKGRKVFLYGGKRDSLIIDKVDLKIIEMIKNNARFSYVDLAEKLNLDARTIKQRVRVMQKKEFLQGYTVFLNINKIGYQLHKLCIYLGKYEEGVEKEISEYLKKNPKTIHLIKCIGDWELEIEMESNNIIEVHEYIAELRNVFHKEIKKVDLITITKEEKLEFFPKISLKDLNN